MHAMDAVELAGHLSQLFRMHNLKEFAPFGPQATFFRSLGLRHRLAQCLKPLVFAGSGLNFSGENHRRRRGATDHGCVGSLQRYHLELFVQRPGKHNVGAAMITGDHAKDHGPFEVHHGSSDLGAIFQLQPRIDSGEPSNPERLARITTGRLLLAALIARATFFEESGKSVPAVHWSGPSAGTNPNRGMGLDSMPMRHTGWPPR